MVKLYCTHREYYFHGVEGAKPSSMKKISILLFAWLLFPQSTASHIEDLPPLCNGQECLEQMVDTYAKEYGVNASEMKAVIACESSWNPNAVNWQDSHKESQGSHGLAQYSKETIAMYGEKIGMADADPYDPEEAIEVMAFMFSINKESQWSCWSKIYGKI